MFATMNLVIIVSGAALLALGVYAWDRRGKPSTWSVFEISSVATGGLMFLMGSMFLMKCAKKRVCCLRLQQLLLFLLIVGEAFIAGMYWDTSTRSEVMNILPKGYRDFVSSHLFEVQIGLSGLAGVELLALILSWAQNLKPEAARGHL